MSEKQERSTLNEIVRMYQNCPERIATYTRFRWIARVSAWFLIFIAFLLSRFENVSCTLCLALALLGGFAGGLTILFTASVTQMPFLVRFTTLRKDEIDKRLEELKDA